MKMAYAEPQIDFGNEDFTVAVDFCGERIFGEAEGTVQIDYVADLREHKRRLRLERIRSDRRERR